ncbi:HAD family hydrolase [Vaginisenegalia massiliensis]|uniref:HAD family hydrolase n=1 Tax=Vaginisenegalia massiliensis TaxID=2058294 RepID=UPI000F5430D7|nr:HAD family hydrolase [Vaginisenegalia massiliensis]
MIKVIGFDLDDTLYDRNQIYRNTYNIMENNVVRTHMRFEEFNKVYQEFSIAEYQLFIAGQKSKLAYKLDRVIRTYEFFGYDIDMEKAYIFDALYYYFRDKIVPRPYMKLLLEMLKNTDLELFILTNGAEADQLNKYHNLELEEYIPRDRFFVSERLGISKPDRRIFQAVQSQLGYASHEILYIGDHPDNDVMGAADAGWLAFYLNLKGQKVEHPNVRSFSDDEAIFRYFNSKINFDLS